MWVYYNVPEAEYLDFKETQKKGIHTPVNLLMANNNQYCQWLHIFELLPILL